MPLYKFKCVACGKRHRVLTSGKAPRTVCDDCGEEMFRDATGPSSRVVEVLDNGIMPRRLERLANAADLAREKGKK